MLWSLYDCHVQSFSDVLIFIIITNPDKKHLIGFLLCTQSSYIVKCWNVNIGPPPPPTPRVMGNESHEILRSCFNLVLCWTGEVVDEQTAQEETEDKLKQCIDNLMDKRWQVFIQSLTKGVTHHYRLKSDTRFQKRKQEPSLKLYYLSF